MVEGPTWMEMWVKGEIRRIVVAHQYEMERAHFGAKNAIEHNALSIKHEANRQAIDDLMKLFVDTVDSIVYNKDIIPWDGKYYCKPIEDKLEGAEDEKEKDK
jgi:hypothetical protein